MAREEGASDGKFYMVKPGDLIEDTYQVDGILGKGGMGVVVKARDIKLDKLVAIKFLQPEVLADREIVERFVQEARVLAKLESRHAVKVYYLGTYHGAPFIVMEHLEGIPLDRFLEQSGCLHQKEAAQYLLHACEAIGEAHSRGIFHRDIKPANMFLAKGASGETILKVLDFGIAKRVRQVDETLRKNGELTRTYTIMGTPPYMSPEQWRGMRGVDGRADIWSLGVVLYELVTGKRPFSAADIWELQKAIVESPPIRGNVPPAVEAIIDKCLQKNPAYRYQSIEELAVALRPIGGEAFTKAPAQPAAPPSNQASGGTAIIRPGTITIPPHAVNTPADTIQGTIVIPPAAPPNSPANRYRNLAIATGGVLGLAIVVGIIIFGILPAPPKITEPSASGVPIAQSTGSGRFEPKTDPVPSNSAPSVPGSAATAEISAPTPSSMPPGKSTSSGTSKPPIPPTPKPPGTGALKSRHDDNEG